jgi:hypothetical protein
MKERARSGLSYRGTTCTCWIQRAFHGTPGPGHQIPLTPSRQPDSDLFHETALVPAAGPATPRVRRNRYRFRGCPGPKRQRRLIPRGLPAANRPWGCLPTRRFWRRRPTAKKGEPQAHFEKRAQGVEIEIIPDLIGKRTCRPKRNDAVVLRGRRAPMCAFSGRCTTNWIHRPGSTACGPESFPCRRCR